jgi:hypothetical protein
MAITGNQYATANVASYGPTFGGGHDIYIADKCNANSSSYSNFPTNFNYNGQYTNGQASYTAFSGGYNYRVVEYEVFRVIH